MVAFNFDPTGRLVEPFEIFHFPGVIFAYVGSEVGLAQSAQGQQKMAF